MKTKIKNRTKMSTTFLVLMIILIPLTSTATQAPLTSTTTQGWTSYSFTRTQHPYELNVRVGDKITVSIDREPVGDDEMNLVLEKGGLFGEIKTMLWFTRTDSSGEIVEKNTEILPDQTLPTMQNPITFVIGPFDDGDVIQYNVWLVLKYATDYDGTPCSSFEVFSEDTPTVPDPYVEPPKWITYVLIGVGVLVVLISLTYFYKKRGES